MIEISNKELDLIQERDSYKSYFYVIIIGLYIIGTVCFSAIVMSNKQAQEINRLNSIVINLTAERISK